MRFSAVLLLLGLSLVTTACHREPTGSTSTTTSAVAPATTQPQDKDKASDELVGKPAPDFSSTAHDGTAVKLSALKGKHVVLYFYPKDETPGCTKEACSFRDAWKDLAATNVVLVGISTDDAESHKKFAEHYKLPFLLISDPDGAIAKSYGVPNRAGYLGRQTFVVGPDGNIKKVYRSVDVTKHAAEVLADVRS